MLRIIFLSLLIISITGCSSEATRPLKGTGRAEPESDRSKTLAIEAKMKAQEDANQKDYANKLRSTGCDAYSLKISKQMFSMAMKYYGTSSSSVSDTPEGWALIAQRACVSGYSAGESTQPQATLDSYLYSISNTMTDPFQFRAVSGAMYWGYGKAMK